MPKINIYDLYQKTLDMCNPVERGLLDVDRFNRMYEVASDLIYDDLTGQRRQYDKKNPEAVTGGFPKTIKISDNLRPFIRRKVIAIGDDNLVRYPDDYTYLVRLRAANDNGVLAEQCKECIDKICKDALPDDPTVDINELIQTKLKEFERRTKHLVNIEVVDSAKKGDRLTSDIEGMRPDKNFPIAEQLQDGFEIDPADLGSVVMVYLTEPQKNVKRLVMTYNESLDTEVYDSVNSVDPEWPTTMAVELASKIASLFAIFVRENGLIQQINAVAPPTTP